jgi:hypothetical protein
VNRDILVVPAETSGPMLLQIQKDRTHNGEMKNKRFDIDVNVWDIPRNVTEPISFHLFHGQSNSTT